jgi:hypothetical protein
VYVYEWLVFVVREGRWMCGNKIESWDF